MDTNTKAPEARLNESQGILERLKRLDDRVDAFEGRGFVCTGCNQKMPGNYYWYLALNTETKKEVAPLCAGCIRGENDIPTNIWGPPWKHNGPFTQPVKK